MIDVKPRKTTDDPRAAGRAAASLALLSLLVLQVVVLFTASPRAENISPPRRVVSTNLCTDQLAMLLAAPGQLYSVSHLASDKAVSAMADEARQYRINMGLAEDIFSMRPDLVLAGSYSTRATVAMLRRLGFHVEEFAPESSFADIRTNLLRVGVLLGREAKAKAVLDEFERKLALYAGTPEKRQPEHGPQNHVPATGGTEPVLRQSSCSDKTSEPCSDSTGGKKRPLAALYFANGFTSGGATLAGEVVEHAGFRNLGKELGFSGTAKLPLETLVMNAPDMIVGGEPDAHAGLAYESLAHPALRALGARGERVSIPDRYTICGTPFTAEAVRILAEAGARFLR